MSIQSGVLLRKGQTQDSNLENTSDKEGIHTVPVKRHWKRQSLRRAVRGMRCERLEGRQCNIVGLLFMIQFTRTFL